VTRTKCQITLILDVMLETDQHHHHYHHILFAKN